MNKFNGWSGVRRAIEHAAGHSTLISSLSSLFLMGELVKEMKELTAIGCPLRIEKWVSERTMKQSRESEPFSFSNSNKNHFYLSSWKKEWAQRARLVKVGLVLLSLRWVMGLPAMALREKKDKPKQANQPAIHNEWSNSLEWKQRRQWNQFIDGMNFCCAMEKQLRNGAERRKQRMEWFVDGQRNAQPQWIDLNLWESMNEGSGGASAKKKNK